MTEKFAPHPDMQRHENALFAEVAENGK